MNDLSTSALLSGAIRRRLMRSIVIKDSKAFERLYGELQQALTAAWTDAMREGIVAALDRLRDLGPGAFTPDDGAAITAALEERVGADALRAAMRKPVVNLSDALFRAGAAEVGSAVGVDLAFRRPDLDALDALKNNNLFWIGESWNLHTKGKIDAILTEYFETGLTRDELALRIADDFRTLTGRSEVYWQAVVDHMATKGREIGRVTGYQRAGIQKVQIRAHLDERTTLVCRHLHGRILTVDQLAEQRDAYFDACARGDVLSAKKVWVMHGKGDDLSSTPTRDLEGVGSPPYHFRCRTITVAYWEPADTGVPVLPAAPASGSDPAPKPRDEVREGLNRWKRAAYDREKLPRKDVGAIIERARTAQWPHSKVVRGHFRKHQKRLGIENQSDFSQSAVDLIRRGNREVYISVRKGVLNATFVSEMPHAETGKPGFIVTAVDLEANKITSHHWRAKLETSNDEVPAVRQPGRGIMKWLIDLLA